MIITDKENTIKDELNYVQLKNGYATYTNTFVMFQVPIVFNGDTLPEETYIHIKDWEKIKKEKSVQYIGYKDGIAKFLSFKNGAIECIAKTDIGFPDISKLTIGDTVFKANLNVATLELILKQMKLEKKHSFTIEFTEKPLCKITGTNHLFTRMYE